MHFKDEKSPTIIYKATHNISGSSFQALTNRQLMTVLLERRKTCGEYHDPLGFLLWDTFLTMFMK